VALGGRAPDTAIAREYTPRFDSMDTGARWNDVITRPLRAVVLGAGWTGEGHAKALTWCGVEVAAICARQPGVVRQVADRQVQDAQDPRARRRIAGWRHDPGA